MKSRFAPVLRQRSLVGLAAALVTGCFLAAPGAMADEERSGFYLRADLGANLATGVTLHGKSNDRASRCDEFINPRYAEIPGCTDPDRGSAAGWRTAFDPASGVFPASQFSAASSSGNCWTNSRWVIPCRQYLPGPLPTVDRSCFIPKIPSARHDKGRHLHSRGITERERVGSVG